MSSSEREWIETRDRLRSAVDDIAQAQDARVDQHEMEDGTWVVSIEHDDWAVTGSGMSEVQALSDLISNAKDEGRAVT